MAGGDDCATGGSCGCSPASPPGSESISTSGGGGTLNISGGDMKTSGGDIKTSGWFLSAIGGKIVPGDWLP